MIKNFNFKLFKNADIIYNGVLIARFYNLHDLFDYLYSLDMNNSIIRLRSIHRYYVDIPFSVFINRYYLRELGRDIFVVENI